MKQEPLAATSDIQFEWLLRLRWCAILGQLLVFVLAAGFFRLSIAYFPFALAFFALVATQVYVTRWPPKSAQRWATGLIVFDTVALSALLYFYGGHTNPFSMMYLAQVILAAVFTSPRWTWAVVIFSSCAYAALFFWGVPINELALHHHGDGNEFSLHLEGMLIAFVLIAALLSFFITRMNDTLKQRQLEVERLQAAVEQEKKLAALSTFAAGAAHELGSPLGTITLAADELLQHVAGLPQSAQEDVQLIAIQTSRCKEILKRMSGTVGEFYAEKWESKSLSKIGVALEESLGVKERSALLNRLKDQELCLALPWESIILVFKLLVKNSLDAHASEIELRAVQHENAIEFVIHDNGSGMSPQILERAGEPFFTTKPVGSGMGLGIFIARSFAQRLQGSLHIDSQANRGTTIRITLPTELSISEHGYSYEFEQDTQRAAG